MSLLNTVGGLAAAKEIYDLGEEQAQDLRTAAEKYKTGAESYLKDVSETAEFQPFSVRTGSGARTDVTAKGDVTQTLGSAEQSIMDTLLGQAQATAGAQSGMAGFDQLAADALSRAQTQLGQDTPTAQSLFDQMQAMRSGETERARLQLENRLAAQGRLGTQTAAFGGTPEALALNKAIQEQQSADMFQALQMAPQLAQQNLAQAQGLFGLGQQAATTNPALQATQLANIEGMLGTAFLPQAQQLSMLNAVTPLQNVVQGARQGEIEAITSLGGKQLEAQAGADLGASDIDTQRQLALLNAVAGMFQGSQGGQSTAESIFDFLKDKVFD